jgi:hypothetical protein
MPPLNNRTPTWANDLSRSITLERAAIDVEKRTVPLSFSSETTDVVRWGDVEILDHSPGACDLTQINDIGVLLFNHNLDMPIGGIESAVIANNRGEAVVRFDDDPEADKYFQKVRSGSLKAVSCRYTVSQWEVVESNAVSSCGRFQGPCWIARKWKPTEISIVSIPADTSVGVGRSAETGESRSDTQPENKFIRSDSNMTPEEIAAEAARKAAEETTRKAAEDAIRVKAQADERVRVTEITSICRAFEVDPAEYINKGTAVDEVRKTIMDEQIRKQAPVSTVRVATDEAEKVRAAMIDGLAMRAGVKIDKPADGANDFRSFRLLRLAEECVERRDGKRGKFSDDEAMIREALTGASQFSGILSNVANKSMSNAYQAVPTTYQIWTGTGTQSDFKTGTRYRISEAGELEKLTSQGEFKHSEVTEAGATVSIGTYGKKFSITRQAIINDDMGALSRIPAIHGAAIPRGINRLVYKVLKDNPTIENAALFHADHKNLAATAAALAVASLGKAKAAMAKQTNIGGKEYLNIQPAYLLVPTELEVTAAQLIGSLVDPSKSNATPNPFANKLTVVSDPCIDDISLTNWYLAAAAGYADTIEVTYLNGRQQPTLESQVSWEVLGIEWRLYFDFGVNLLDFRGLYKNAGA